MKKSDVIDAYCRIRTIDNTIPDDVLDFMKDAAVEKLEKFEKSPINLPKWLSVEEMKVIADRYQNVDGIIYEAGKGNSKLYAVKELFSKARSNGDLNIGLRECDQLIKDFIQANYL